MKFGKGMMKQKSGGESSGGGSGGLGNPLALLKQFDRDGDGNITENGLFLCLIFYLYNKFH